MDWGAWMRRRPVRIVPALKCGCGCEQFAVVQATESVFRTTLGGVERETGGVLAYCARFGHHVWIDARSGVVERLVDPAPPEVPRGTYPRRERDGDSQRRPEAPDTDLRIPTRRNIA